MIKLEWRPVSLGTGGIYAGPTISTSLTNNETLQLQELAKDAEVLEIGSAYGYSAVAMALAGAAHITAIDPHSWLNSHATMMQNLVDYRVLEKVSILRADSWTAMPQLIAENRKFDLVWIDGDHEAHTVAHDVQMARELLREDGTLACHDYDEATCPGVRQALDAWKVPPRLVDTLAIYGPGEW